jgi:hypothetical protein
MVQQSLLAAAVVLTALGGSEAHVKLVFTPLQMPIRNAASATGDGSFSTSGPCGGSNKLGAMGFNVVQDGQQLCAKINYNGGHANAANRFRATFACGAALGTGTQTVMQSLTPLKLKEVPGVSTKIEADGISVNSAVNTAAGYTLCVDLPKQNLGAGVADTDVRRQCTMSILDQRQWGGCIDMKIASGAVPTAPPTPIVPQTFSAAAAGTYTVNTCDTETGGNCCLKGTLAVTASGSVTGSLTAITMAANAGQKETATDAALCASFSANINTKLVWDGSATPTFTAQTMVASKTATNSQPFKFEARDPVKNGIVLENTSDDAPLILGAKAVRTGALPPATAPSVPATAPSVPATRPTSVPATLPTEATPGTAPTPVPGTAVENGAGATQSAAADGGFPVAVVGVAAAAVLIVGAVVASRRPSSHGAVAVGGHGKVGQYNPQYQQQQGYRSY